MKYLIAKIDKENRKVGREFEKLENYRRKYAMIKREWYKIISDILNIFLFSLLFQIFPILNFILIFLFSSYSYSLPFYLDLFYLFLFFFIPCHSFYYFFHFLSLSLILSCSMANTLILYQFLSNNNI